MNDSGLMDSKTLPASPPRGVVIKRLSDPNDRFKIYPTPRTVGYGSIDLRLGTIFLTAERSGLTAVSAEQLKAGKTTFKETRISPGGVFIVHPRQFVLACTFEYIALPRDLVGLIQSRSTYGRLGLIAVTAAFVGPGFKGCPTLELVNVGEVAIELRPHQDFCQLILLTADEQEEPSPSRYQCSTRPSFAREPFTRTVRTTA